MNAIIKRLPRPVATALWAGLVVLFLFCLAKVSPAQDDRAVGDTKPASQQQLTPQQQQQHLQDQQDDADADAAAMPAPDPLKSTTADNTRQAWGMLRTFVSAKKPIHRIQALGALATMGSDPQAAALITAAMQDSEQDVRVAAILAAGQTENHALATPIHAMLEDKRPGVAYTAASTLWKMGDKSGEDILMAVADGDRRSANSMMAGTAHSANKEFHDPAALSKDAAMQIGGLFLGPFGYGLTAYEFMKKSGGVSARGSAIDLLSEEKTEPIHHELLEALSDKDAAVRAAAAKALGYYHDRESSNHLLPLFADQRLGVRLTAAAAYIRTLTGISSKPQPNITKMGKHHS